MISPWATVAERSPMAIFTIPATTRNLDKKPASGGTPASDSMKMNMAAASNGSLFPKPARFERRDAPPSISKTASTKKAPILKATNTTRWNKTAPRMAPARSDGAFTWPHFQAPMAVSAANIYPA